MKRILLAVFYITSINQANAASMEYCERYAKISIKQYQKNFNACFNKQGYNSRQWSHNHQMQKKWCLSKPQVVAEKEIQTRRKLLNRCKKNTLGRELHNAAANNDITSIKNLLKQGVNIEYQLKGNYGSPLQTAIVSGSGKAARLLLKQGANTRSTSNAGTNLLTYIIWQKKPDYDLLKLMFKYGASVDGIGKGHPRERPILAAINRNDAKAVKTLLAFKPNLNNDCVLTKALKKKNQTITRLLQKAGAKIKKECH